jgi:ubiquitin-protein ligase
VLSKSLNVHSDTFRNFNILAALGIYCSSWYPINPPFVNPRYKYFHAKNADEICVAIFMIPYARVYFTPGL